MSQAIVEDVHETDPAPTSISPGLLDLPGEIARPAADEIPEIVTGLDLSAFQIPKLVDWPAIRRAGHRFVIARATYGTFHDAAFLAHMAGARAEGLALGGYAFFRQTQPVADQLAALVAQYEAAGLGCGDIVPAIDIESNTPHDGQPRPALYNGAGRELVEAVAERFGRAIVYCAPGFWAEMGHPAWMLEHAIWTAHWGVAAPAWPKSEEWAIWQDSNNYRMGPLQFDHNKARHLPRIG